MTNKENIEQLLAIKKLGCLTDKDRHALNSAIKALEERPQGEWIFKHNSSDIWCSVCDENFDEIPQAFNFCPNCGADMKGDKK